MAAPIAVCGTVEGSDATSRDATRVRRGGPISAKHTVAGNGVRGPQGATSLQGGGVDSVQLMVL